jgi:hypothetical protein
VEVEINQFTARGTWVSLGTYPFLGEPAEGVLLVDETGEADGQFRIAFDAIALRPPPPMGDQMADQVARWQDRLLQELEPYIQPWVQRQLEALQAQLKQWIARQKIRFVRELQQAVSQWLEETCLGPPLTLLPFAALVVIGHKRRGRR